MLHLSSGRVVDLSTDRARYHALRHQGPSPDAAHRSLYKLVDIIYRKKDADGIAQTGWTEFDYTFSGYTLADISKASDWSSEEKAELFQWAVQTAQKQRIENCRRRLSAEQQQITSKQYTAPQYLYSRLINVIESHPQQRCKGAQWLATLSNIQGLREEELKWSGVLQFLKKHADKTVLKDDLVKAIDYSHIRLSLSAEKIKSDDGGLSFREVAMQMPHQAVYRATLKLDTACRCILRYIDDHHHYRVGVVKTADSQHKMALNRFWFALDPYGRPLTNRQDQSHFFSNSESAKAAADRHAHQQKAIKKGTVFNTRYDHLTLYGGENYREWLICLPDYQRIFFGAHYFDHNILAHVRTTTRTDKNGNRLLFIEEIQSDWHQNGHMHGYDNSYWGKVADAPYKKEWVSLALKLILIHASQNGFDGIGWPDGNIQETRYTKSLAAIMHHYDSDMPKAANRLGKPFHCSVERSTINTRDPWLNLVRSENKWRVSDGTGKFETRDKYKSRNDALKVVHCHCKEIELEISTFIINDAMRWQIATRGLPLFGEAY